MALGTPLSRKLNPLHKLPGTVPEEQEKRVMEVDLLEPEMEDIPYELLVFYAGRIF